MCLLVMNTYRHWSSSCVLQLILKLESELRVRYCVAPQEKKRLKCWDSSSGINIQSVSMDAKALHTRLPLAIMWK